MPLYHTFTWRPLSATAEPLALWTQSSDPDLDTSWWLQCGRGNFARVRMRTDDFLAWAGQPANTILQIFEGLVFLPRFRPVLTVFTTAWKDLITYPAWLRPNWAPSNSCWEQAPGFLTWNWGDMLISLIRVCCDSPVKPWSLSSPPHSPILSKSLLHSNCILWFLWKNSVCFLFGWDCKNGCIVRMDVSILRAVPANYVMDFKPQVWPATWPAYTERCGSLSTSTGGDGSTPTTQQ